MKNRGIPLILALIFAGYVSSVLFADPVNQSSVVAKRVKCFSISPAKSYVAVVTEENEKNLLEVCGIGHEGGEPVTTVSGSVFQPAWSDDGKTLAFAACKDKKLVDSSLFVYHLDSKNLVDVGIKGIYRYVNWLPSSHIICASWKPGYVDPATLILMNPEKPAGNELTKSETLSGRLKWLADPSGKTIFFVDLLGDGYYWLEKVNVLNKEIRKIIPCDGIWSISGDGKLLLLSNLRQNDKYDIFLYSTTRNEVVWSMMVHGLRKCAMSPDTKNIAAYIQEKPHGKNLSVSIIDVARSRMEVISENGPSSDLSSLEWSGDDEFLWSKGDCINVMSISKKAGSKFFCISR